MGTFPSVFRYYGEIMKPIAYIHTDFPEKFGIPRQSGVIHDLKGTIYFEKEYRNVEAVRGLDGFDYIWLIWQFQHVESEKWSVTVRPPRLGGNRRMGVFATRSPFRPNAIGLSSVKLDKIEITAGGPVLHVSGVDLKDRTPILDIKPYLPYTDAHPDAREGFASDNKDRILEVTFPKELLEKLPKEKRQAALEILQQDPRPHYHMDPKRTYGVSFAGYNILFMVENSVVKVLEVEFLLE